MLHTIYGFDDLGRKVPTGSYDDGLKAVGGRIFYIDSNSDETVKFYDAQGNELQSVSVGDTPAYYKVTNVGVSGKEKYYVYDNITGILEDTRWGYSGITTGATNDSIGSGKTNTLTILSIEDTSYIANYSMFKYLRETQNAGTGTNGCTDWYIGSRAELEALRVSGISEFFTPTTSNIWCSVELPNNNTYAYEWWGQYQTWSDNNKGNEFDCLFFRSF